MALPRRKEKEILLDPEAIKRVIAVKKQVAVSALIQGFETDDADQRLRALSAFGPDEQRALRDEIERALGPQAPLDLPRLTPEEETYLEPEEQRNVRLVRAFQLRGVQEPTLVEPLDLTVTSQERLRRQNEEYERILRQDTGVRRAEPGAAGKLVLGVLAETLGEAATAAARAVAPLPVIPAGVLSQPETLTIGKVTAGAVGSLAPVGEALRVTEALTATGLAAVSKEKKRGPLLPLAVLVTEALEMIRPGTDRSMGVQANRLAARIAQDGWSVTLKGPEDNAIVQAYETTEYPIGAKPLMSVVDPTNLVPIGIGGKAAGKLTKAALKELTTEKVAWDVIVQNIRAGRSYIHAPTGTIVSGLDQLFPRGVAHAHVEGVPGEITGEAALRGATEQAARVSPTAPLMEMVERTITPGRSIKNWQDKLPLIRGRYLVSHNGRSATARDVDGFNHRRVWFIIDETTGRQVNIPVFTSRKAAIEKARELAAAGETRTKLIQPEAAAERPSTVGGVPGLVTEIAGEAPGIRGQAAARGGVREFTLGAQGPTIPGVPEAAAETTLSSRAVYNPSIEFIQPKLMTPSGLTPVSADEFVRMTSWDMTLPERLTIQAKRDLLLNLADNPYTVWMREEHRGFALENPEDDKTALEALQRIIAGSDVPEELAGIERLHAAALPIIRDLSRGDSITTLMNTVQLWASQPERIELATRAYNSKINRAWRWIYTKGPLKGMPRAVNLMRQVHNNRFHPITQEVGRGLIHGRMTAEVFSHAARARWGDKLKKAVPTFDTSRGFTDPKTLPQAIAEDSRYYDKEILDYAVQRKWITEKAANSYRWLDGYQHSDQWLPDDATKALYDDVLGEFTEMRSRERRVGIALKDVDVLGYLPGIWDLEESFLDWDDLGEAVFKPLYANMLEGPQMFQHVKMFPNIRVAVRRAVELRKAAEAAGESIDNIPIPKLRDDIEYPTDLLVKRIEQSERAIARKLFEDESAKAIKANPYLTDEFKELRVVIRDRGGLGESWLIAPFAALADNIRALRFGTDLGVIGVQGIIGTQAYLLTNPRWVIETWARASGAAVTDADAWILANRERLLRAKRDGLTFAMGARDIKGKAFIEKIPVIPYKGKWYNPIAALNEFQFNRIMMSIKLDAYELNREMLAANSHVNRAIKGFHKAERAALTWTDPRGNVFSGISDIEAGKRSAAHVNALFGGLNKADFLYGPGVQEISKLFLNTPQFFIGTTQVVLRAMEPGFDGFLARGFLLRLYATSAALVYAVNTMQGETSELLDPNDPDWMMIKFGDMRLSPLGRFRAYARVVYTAIADPINFAKGNKEAIRTDERLLQFAKGRASIYVQAEELFGTQKTFLGEPVFVEGGPSIRNMETYGAIGQQLLSPLGMGQVMEDIRLHKFTWLNTYYTILGFTSYNLDPIAEATKTKFAEEVALVLQDADVMGTEVLTAVTANARARDFSRQNRPFDAFLRADGERVVDGFTSNVREGIIHKVAERTLGLGKDDPLPPEMSEIIYNFGIEKTLTAFETQQAEKFYPKVTQENVNRYIWGYTKKDGEHEPGYIDKIQALDSAVAGGNMKLREAFEIQASLDVEKRAVRTVGREKRDEIMDRTIKWDKTSDRQLLFEQWLDWLNESIDATGEIDWRARKQIEQQIESHPEYTRFLEWLDSTPEYGAVQQLRYQVIQQLEPWFDLTLPKSLGGLVPDDVIDDYDAIKRETTKNGRARLYMRMGVTKANKVYTANVQIENAKLRMRQANPTIDFALYIYRGTKPVNPKVYAQVLGWSRGTMQPEDIGIEKLLEETTPR